MVSEIFKQLKNAQIETGFYFLRTYDQKEVDLLLEFNDYYYAFEVKMAEKISTADIRHFYGLDEILDKPVKKAFLLSNDRKTWKFADNIIAVHAAMFLDKCSPRCLWMVKPRCLWMAANFGFNLMDFGKSACTRRKK